MPATVPDGSIDDPVDEDARDARPATKRARTETILKQSESSIKRRMKGKLSKLSGIPLDVLFEVGGYFTL